MANHKIKSLIQTIATCSVALMVLGALLGCDERAMNAPNTFSEPKTRLFTDSIGVVQSSRVTLRWFGDVQDGFVTAYFVSFDRQNWRFTQRQDSAFSLRLFTTDTSFSFSVAAARTDGGNNRYDTSIIRGGFNFGPEPFTDANGNGRYENGENFIDIGPVDTNPPSVRFPVRNSFPTLEIRSQTPDTTLPVIQFDFLVADVDGLETISRLDIALNDSLFLAANTVQVPVNNTFMQVLLSATNPRALGTTTGQVFTGNSTTPLSRSLPNWQIGGTNVLYVRVVDAAGAASPRLAALDSGRTWFTAPITSTLAVIDDFGELARDPLNAADTTEAALRMLLPRIRGGKYTGNNAPQILDIRATGNTDLGRRAAQYSRPFVLSRLLLNYNVILWTADGLPNMELAAFSLPDLLLAGKNVLFNTGFSATPTILEFSPASGVTRLGLSNLNSNMTLPPLSPFTQYPTVRYNGILRFSSYQPAVMSLQVGSESIYELPSSLRGTLSANSVSLVARRIYRSPANQPLGRIIFCTSAFYRVANLAGNLDQFYETVFRDEFGE
ncbi:MAG: hypothetical protein SFU91_08225 [Chloroherpetonaceae bacterium]|nr:hypothetical protein [Chloroherpetonaceae bacterium]